MSATTRGRLQAVSQDADDEQLVNTVNSLVNEVNSLREENDDLRAETERLEDELAESRRQQAEDRKRISELEDKVEELEAEQDDDEDAQDDAEDAGSPDATHTPDAEESGCTTPQTPLGRIVALPERMAQSELTANQERACFVAKDVMNYTRSVPAGRAIKSSEIGTVLRAGTDCKGRSQTVSRVIEFLDELGGDGVEVVERRGERRVVFSEETGRRLQQLSGPDAVDAGGSASNEVVAGTRG